MATSNVPVPTFGPKGFIAPTEAEINAGVTADINAAFGGGLNPAPTTPQGQLAVSTTAIIGNKNDVFVKMASQFDPAYAEGRMQDALGRIYFLERNPAEPTAVQAVCGGAANTVIPVGALAKSADGNLYVCTQEGTIGASGIVTLTFACTTTGPIPCPPDSLDTIYRAIPGWDTINNPTSGVLGRLVEGRNDFEQRRAASVALNATGTLPAIRATVLNVPGVLDAYVIDNATSAAVTKGGVTLAKNSLYVAVVGGAAADVAQAIWRKKNPGCGYNGNTTITVVDDNSGYSVPYPSYEVTYQIPAVLPVLFDVQIADSAEVPADAPTLIANAIINAFTGSDGGPRATIGSTLFASRFYSAVATLGPWAQIVSITIGSANDPVASFSGYITGSTLTVMSVTSGTLNVEDAVSGPGVLPGTTIVGLGSGTGGAGTYNVSKAQEVGMRTLTTVDPGRNDLVVRIDQVPTIDAADIMTTLV